MSSPGGGGQTFASPSGWTVDTAKEYADDQRAALSRRLDERYEAQNEKLDERYESQKTAMETALTAQKSAMETAFVAQKTAMETAFNAADKAVDKALEAAEKAVRVRQDAADREFHEHLEQVRHETATAFEASGKAIEKAEAATDKRFESVNEFRAQLADQAQRFMPRTEAEGSIGRNTERLQELTTTFANMISRAEITAMNTAAEAKSQIFLDRMSEIEKRITRSEGAQSGKVSSLNGLVAGLGALGVLVSIAVGIIIIIVNT